MLKIVVLVATIALPNAAFAQASVSSSQKPVLSISSQPVPGKCDSQENRQFDFWVGHWKVFDAVSGKPAGESVIERLYGGCTIRVSPVSTCGTDLRL